MENTEQEKGFENRPQETSGWAIASLILGIIGMCTIILSPLAIIFGILGMHDADKQKKGGKNMAIVGLVMGAIGMVLIPILGIVAAIAIPGVIMARLKANEHTAIAILKTVTTAQAAFQNDMNVDQDKDGTGEYGFLRELTGRTIPRGKSDPISFPALSSTLVPGENGMYQKSGYFFYVYLPANSDLTQAIGENDAAIPPGEEVNVQEVHWVCYAWPISYGSSGKRVFAVTSFGEVFSAPNHGGMYSGDIPPPFNAAFSDGWTAGGMGKDGQSWAPVY